MKKRAMGWAVCAVVMGVVSSAAWGQPVAKEGGKFAAGEKVEVKWGSSWHKAEVVKVGRAQFYIKYDGWPDSNNEWVTADRVRALGKAGVANDGIPPEPGTEAGVVTADRSGAREAIGDVESAWKYEVDAGATPRVSDGPVLLTAGTGDFFDAVEGMRVSANGERAVVVHVNNRPGRDRAAGVTWLEGVDLKAARSLGVGEIPGKKELLGVSPDGGRVIVMAKHFSGDRSKVEVWSVRGKQTSLVAAWRAVEEATNKEWGVDWAGFVDDQRVLTWGKKELVLWELGGESAGGTAVRAVWVMKVDGWGTPVLSPGGKYVVLPMKDDAAVIDARTGTVAGRFGAGGVGRVMAFSGDGKKIAEVAASRLRVWDLTGKEAAVVQDAGLPPGVGGPVMWAGAEYVIVDGRWVVDVRTGAVAWEYSRGRAGRGVDEMSGGKLWYVVPKDVASKRKPVLAAVALPHDAAKKAAAAIDADKVMVVRPGARVSLEVNVEGGEVGRKAVVEELTKLLSANGVTVDPGAAIKLVAETTPGETRDVEYRMFGSFRNEKVKAQEVKLRLAFVGDGKTLWEQRSMAGVPGFIHLKEKETVEQAVARHRQESYKWFTAGAVPKFVPGAREWGKSEVGVGGVRK